MGILIAIIGLSFIIFIHELGHAVVAYLIEVRVEIFSIGIGSPYFSFKWGATEIRISPFRKASLPSESRKAFLDDVPHVLDQVLLN